MQCVNHAVNAHAFTSTSSDYAIENTETVKVQSDVYRRKNSKEGNSSNKNNNNNKDISIFFVRQHQRSIIVKHKQK